jgi:hypothetical protein
MKAIQRKLIGSVFASAALALVLCTTHASATDQRAPDLTGVATNIAVGSGYKVHFHAYAIGFQIYHWNAALGTWGASTPAAILYDADGNQVGTHFAGPTWESNSGSFVRGAVLQRATPDINAIPWLLLQAINTDGPGIFEPTKFVQRVNTVGGKAPSGPGAFDGEEADIPYTAEYYFYREI